MVNENTFNAVAPALSVTCTVKEDVPAVMGVPLSTPAELKLRPGGGVPTVIAQFVYGVAPPLAANVCEYAVPTEPCGNGEAVLITRAALMVNENTFKAVAPALSVACTVKVDVPAVVGVPPSTPAALKLRPGGGVPAVIAQFVYCVVPPLAANDCEYAAPTEPGGNGEAVVITRTALMVNEKAFKAVAPALSVTRTVKVNVPAVVGVPLSKSAPLKPRPGGSAPAATAQFTNGGVPPPAVKACE